MLFRSWHFQRKAGGHDLAPNAGDMVVEQRPRVAGLNFVNDLNYPIGPEKGGAFLVLELSHLFGHPRALIEQRKQLGIQLVNLRAQHTQCIRLNRLRQRGGVRGWRQERACAHGLLLLFDALDFGLDAAGCAIRRRGGRCFCFSLEIGRAHV